MPIKWRLCVTHTTLTGTKYKANSCEQQEALKLSEGCWTYGQCIVDSTPGKCTGACSDKLLSFQMPWSTEKFIELSKNWKWCRHSYRKGIFCHLSKTGQTNKLLMYKAQGHSQSEASIAKDHSSVSLFDLGWGKGSIWGFWSTTGQVCQH